MSYTENQPVTAGQIANSVADDGIAIANRCQWQCQFSGSGFQPVEKQQKQVAASRLAANHRFSYKNKGFGAFCSLLRYVWKKYEDRRAEWTHGRPNPEGMGLRGPANAMARCAAIALHSRQTHRICLPSEARSVARKPRVAWALSLCLLALLSGPLSAQSTWGTSSAFDLQVGTEQRERAAQALQKTGMVWGASAPKNVWSNLDAFERGKAGKPAPSLRSFTLPSGPKLNRLFAVIAFAEAPRRRYDAIHGSATRLPSKRPTQMTLGEIKTWIKDTPGQHHAIGNFQIIPSTLLNLQRRLGLPDATVFNRATQNRMGALLVADAGYSRAVAGTLPLSQFMDNLARIWAGLPLETGKSAYHGYAGNRATVTRAFFAKQVTEIFG